MRLCGAHGAGSSGHNLEVIVLHLVPATATPSPTPGPSQLSVQPTVKVLRAADSIYFRRQ